MNNVLAVQARLLEHGVDGLRLVESVPESTGISLQVIIRIYSPSEYVAEA